MKHFLILLFITLVSYFAWQYTPSRPKFFIKEFLGRHLMIVAILVIALMAGLFLQTMNHATKII